MKISIAMATYNGGKYLIEQLNSFLKQARMPDELIVFDDCSTDETLEILESFSKAAPFFVRWQKNEKTLGYAQNFNRALLHCNGDLVLLSDQDDVWFPDKIKIMEQLASEDNENIMFINDALLTNSNLESFGTTKLAQIRSAGFSETSFVMGCCGAYKRELLDICLPVLPGYKAHDLWISKFAEGFKRKRVIGQVLQYYRRHEANSSKFIANRVKKVNKLAVFINQLRVLKNSSGRHNEKIDQLEILLKGIRESTTRCNETYKKDIKNLEEITENELDYYIKRSMIGHTRGIEKYRIITNLMLRNKHDRYGLKEAISDLIFK